MRLKVKKYESKLIRRGEGKRKGIQIEACVEYGILKFVEDQRVREKACWVERIFHTCSFIKQHELIYINSVFQFEIPNDFQRKHIKRESQILGPNPDKVGSTPIY